MLSIFALQPDSVGKTGKFRSSIRLPAMDGPIGSGTVYVFIPPPVTLNLISFFESQRESPTIQNRRSARASWGVLMRTMNFEMPLSPA